MAAGKTRICRKRLTGKSRDGGPALSEVDWCPRPPATYIYDGKKEMGILTTQSDAAKATAAHPGPYISFRNVSKAFGENRVLDNVTFDVEPAETVCILGRSGVGKSVALQHILGFLKADAGRITVAHEDITDYPERELESIGKEVTMVFQSAPLFAPPTVGHNAPFPLRERKDLSEDQIFQIVNGLLEM